MRTFSKILSILVLTTHQSSEAMRIRPEMPTSVSAETKDKIQRAAVVLEVTRSKVDGRTASFRPGEDVEWHRAMGTLINPQLILTPASTGQHMSGGWATINGKRYAIEAVFPFPRFFPGGGGLAKHNIALIKLKDAVEDIAEFPEPRVTNWPFKAKPFVAVGTRAETRIFSEELGWISTPDFVSGEISDLGYSVSNMDGGEIIMDQFQNQGWASCIITVGSEVRPLRLRNFDIDIAIDLGGGLFDSLGHVYGFLLSTWNFGWEAIQTPDQEYAPAEAQFGIYLPIDENVFQWIHRTIRTYDAAQEGPGILAFLMAARRPESGLTALPSEVVRHIAGLVAPSLYTNHGGWITRIRERNAVADPSHVQNVRALLADPMMPDANANIIADLLRIDIANLDRSGF